MGRHGMGQGRSQDFETAGSKSMSTSQKIFIFLGQKIKRFFIKTSKSLNKSDELEKPIY